MEKRFLLAFVLSLLVLVASQLLLEKKFKPARPSGAAIVPSEKNTVPEPAAKSMSVEMSKLATASAPAADLKASNEHDVVLENGLVKVVLTNRGGIVKSWILKRYKDSSLHTLDLVAATGQAQQERPLQISLEDGALTAQLASAFFVDSRIESKDIPAGVRFHYSENGIEVIKSLTLRTNSYLTDLKIEVRKNGQEIPCMLAWPALFGDNALDIHTSLRQVVTGYEGKIDSTSLVKVKGTKDLTGIFKFAGVEDGYFAAMFLPDSPVTRLQLSEAGAFIALPSRNIRFYVGPKEIDLLRNVDPQLASLIDFGWFSLIGKPLFLGLKWIYGFCRNYGLAVIILTAIINFALFPLRWKSMISAQKMQKLQPRIKAIQERYKKYKVNDPKRQEMNQEMMALYKEHGVNPLGGCLPLLLQMPILVAFYNVLRVAIDLRQVSFLWIPDLSQYDKTFVLVIIMVLTQFVMQKLTPTPSADPAQAKMFMFMPLIFGFMFAKVASGLVLYWLTGNVIGIIQQVFLNKLGLAAPGSPEGKD